MYVKHAAFLEQPIDAFDAGFFHISPREAGQLDPQQRLLLEVSWEAFEDAGIDVWGMRGSSTGVFVGTFMLDNLAQRVEPNARDEIGPQTATTCTNTVLASRLSYFYDLRGPAFTVDTACSSSLVAVHQAAQALKTGECDVALAGGVNRIFRPEPMLMMSKGQFLARDGRSKSFSANADGYGRGEGCGLVVLKRLNDAERDSDRIYGVIEGSGVNQDGRTGGPAFPSSAAQAELIRTVLERFEIDPASISYVEAHGTGTPVGDPAEAEAIGRTIGTAAGRARPCVIGSIKAGVGHLEGAAGVLGLIKAALVVSKGEVPAQAWMDELNSEIDFDGLGVQVATNATPLAFEGKVRRVAVNSFGYGGTNAHAVLRSQADAPERDGVAAALDRTAFFPRMAVLSGHNDDVVSELAAAYAAHLRGNSPATGEGRAFLARMAHRTAHEDRAVAFASQGDLAEVLDQMAADGAHPDVIRAKASPATEPARPVFVFSGMGPQWWAMGRSLREYHSGFQALVERCDRIFKPLAGWSIDEALVADECSSQMARTAVAQPCSFVLQVGLSAVLAELGVEPAAAVGHSVGEVAAAYEAGALSLRDALTVIYHRSRLQAATTGTGAMLATDLGADAAEALASSAGDEVSVAAVNGPQATTLAGDRVALERLARTVEEDGGFARLLEVEVAYHSPSMDPILGELRSSLAGVTPLAGRLPLYSTVGPEHDGGGWGSDYWSANARQPVAFWAALQRLVEDGNELFLEIGAHPVLAMYLRDAVAKAHRGSVVSTLHGRRDDRASLAATVARLWTLGVQIDWAPILGEERPIGLPLYPWQRQYHWQESETTRRVRTGCREQERPLAGHLIAANPATREIELGPTTVPWCRDHLVDGTAVFPATGYLEVIAAHAQSRDGTGHEATVIEDLQIDRPIVIPEERDVCVQLVEDSDLAKVTLTSSERGRPGSSRQHATARIGRGRFLPPPSRECEADECLDDLPLDIKEMYDALAAVGLEYRGEFQAVTRIRHAHDRVEVDLNASGAVLEGYAGYPPVLDAGLHGALAAFALVDRNLYLPVWIHRTIFHAPLTPRCMARAVLIEQDGDQLVADCSFWNEDGQCLVELNGIQLTRVARRSSDEAWLDTCSYETRWFPEVKEKDMTVGSGEFVRRLVLLNPSPELRTACSRHEGTDVTIDIIDDVSARDLSTVGTSARVVAEVPAHNSDDVTSDLIRVVNLLQAMAGQAGASVALVTWNAVGALPDDRTRGWEAGWVTGLRRVADNELHQLSLHQIDHDGKAFDLVADLLCRTDLGDERVVRDGQVYGPELGRLAASDKDIAWWEHQAPGRPATDCENFVLEQAGGTFDGLVWTAGTRQAPRPGEVELRVDMVGLNYKDILKQLGRLRPNMTTGTFVGSNLGMEASVVVERIGEGVTHLRTGQRYLATLASGTFRRYVTVEAAEARLLEDNTTLTSAETAASLVAFGTAHRAVTDLGCVGHGDVVLLHGATGSFGLAAIQVARAHGARVLATASTEKKRRILAEAGVEATFDSRSHNFIAEVQAYTESQGVDVVVNTLPDDGLRANFEVLAENGRLIDISKREILENASLPLNLFNRNVTFAALDLDQLACDAAMFVTLGQSVLDRLASGEYTPVPCVIFPAHKVKDSFTLQARAEHIGKVVIDLTATEELTCLEPAPQIEVRANRTYVITGGTGGLGPYIAAWLADRGARYLILMSRSGRLDENGVEVVEKLQAAGASIDILAVDITDDTALSATLDYIRSQGPPIGGIVHAAGVSHDLPLEALTTHDIHVVLAPKVRGAANLDRFTQDDPIELFMLLSSVSATTGTSGQAAYSAANAALEALSRKRRGGRHPGIALGLGPVDNVGMAAQTEQISRYVELLGFNLIPLRRLPQILDWAVTMNRPVIGAYDIDWSTLADAELKASSTSRLAGVIHHAESGVKANAKASSSRLKAMSEDERKAVLAEYLIDTLTVVLGLEVGTLDSATRLDNLGLDSLMLLEIQTRLAKMVKVDLGFVDLLQAESIEEVVQAMSENV